MLLDTSRSYNCISRRKKSLLYSSPCFILPSPILEEIIKTGTNEQKDRALNTLRISERIRGQRHILSRMQQNLFLSSGSIQSHRIIYDMQNHDDNSFLPGKKVREESDPDTTDKEIDNAFRNTGITFDFYKDVFKRNSVDDAGAILISSVNFGTDFDNAFWDGRQMVFGNGGGGLFKRGTLTATLNVIAHELTHGVTNNTADLLYSGESGGLNEAISDIFGIMCEQWNNGQTVNDSNWLIGEAIFEKGQALRDMKGGKANPYDKSIFSYKDFKKWMNVHWTSGIANKAFYVAAKEIGGHVWEKTGKIWYIVLTQGWLSRLGPRINGTFGRSFQEAANATYTVAGQLYGEASTEQEAVRKGWEAVDIIPKKEERPSILEMPSFEQIT